MGLDCRDYKACSWNQTHVYLDIRSNTCSDSVHATGREEAVCVCHVCTVFMFLCWNVCTFWDHGFYTDLNTFTSVLSVVLCVMFSNASWWMLFLMKPLPWIPALLVVLLKWSLALIHCKFVGDSLALTRWPTETELGHGGMMMFCELGNFT